MSPNHSLLPMKQDQFTDVWSALVKSKELVEDASVANSFPILLVLNGAERPLTTTDVSERISSGSKGSWFLLASTARSSLEVLEKHELVTSQNIENKGKGAKRKPTLKSLYAISPKGRRLVKHWVKFLSAED
jgi:DNA-binding PadR family transcriptional regulator